MDSLITAAAQALAAGDPLGALDRVALRDDAPALALRGIAMAQLGDLLGSAQRWPQAVEAYGPKEAVARARCVVAEAEIALASRELGWPVKALDAARVTLMSHGDAINATHARYLQIRRLLLIGQLDEAQALLGAHGARRAADRPQAHRGGGNRERRPADIAPSSVSMRACAGNHAVSFAAISDEVRAGPELMVAQRVAQCLKSFNLGPFACLSTMMDLAGGTTRLCARPWAWGWRR